MPPHGHRELSHPEPGFYTIGVKSYGRAPTFLLLTGYEQARSVVAAIAGDMEAADNVQLVLPETGVCTTDFVEDGAGCCGGPAPARSRCLLRRRRGREGGGQAGLRLRTEPRERVDARLQATAPARAAAARLHRAAPSGSPRSWPGARPTICRPCWRKPIAAIPAGR